MLEKIYKHNLYSHFICVRCGNIISIFDGFILFNFENLEFFMQQLDEYHNKAPMQCHCNSKKFIKVSKEVADAYLEYRIKKSDSSDKKRLLK